MILYFSKCTCKYASFRDFSDTPNKRLKIKVLDHTPLPNNIKNSSLRFWQNHGTWVFLKREIQQSQGVTDLGSNIINKIKLKEYAYLNSNPKINLQNGN